MSNVKRAFAAALLAAALGGAGPVRADGDIKKVKHVVILMQENHSFDNYFGALAFAPGSPGPLPRECASFNQLGVRVPFIAVSPFSKRRHVSHTVGDHTSLLAFIEKRSMAGQDGERPHLTRRDQHADTLEDLFDFDRSPSRDTTIGHASPPAVDCTP